MESIEVILSSSMISAIGWTVIHSLWQVSIVVLLYYFISVYDKPQKARHKYVLAYSAMIFQFILSVSTFLTLYKPTLEIGFEEFQAAESPVFLIMDHGVMTSVGLLDQISLFLEPALPVIVFIWGVGMLFFFVRMLFGYVFWCQIKRKNVLAVSEEWQQLFQTLKDKMKISSRVEVGLSSMISSPVLVGHLKPVVLLPLALVNQLTINEVEGILVHELAHLKRYDFLLNILQLLIESVFYYHPLIWWLGREIRSLREDCADDLALVYTDDSVTYARTLLSVAEHSQLPQQIMVPALLGQDKKHLLTRIQRILQQPIKQPDMREKFVVTSLLLLMAIVISLGAAWTSPKETVFTDQENCQISIDTLPMGEINMKVNDDGETMKVSIKDGAIQSLSVNGEAISEEEFPNYEERVEKMLRVTPPLPPSPPPPPADIGTMSPPSPPTPPIPPSFRKRLKIHKLGENDIKNDIDVLINEIEEGGQKYIWIEDDTNEDGHLFYIDTDELQEIDDIFIHSMDDMNILLDSISEGLVENVWLLDSDEPLFIKKGEGGHHIVFSNEDFDFDFENMDEALNALIEDEALDVEEKRRVIEDRMEARRATIEKAMEASREQVEEQMKRMEERQHEMEETIEQRHKETKRKAKQEVNKNKWLERSLLDDGLINDSNNYSLKLNNKRLKVNGKTTSDTLHEKYMNLYEKHRGIDFSENSNISVTKRNEEN